MEDTVSPVEIKRAVWDCGLDKSLGPDDFTFEFLKKYRSLVEAYVIDVVQDFFLFARFPKGCNPSFITLIPKVSSAKFVKDFRPISLIGCQYKIIAKILANRLSMVISDLVNKQQYAFVVGRQILDDPLIRNEFLSWCKTKKKKAMIFKVDFEKMYDSVKWDFLDDILGKFGFGTRWQGWIRGCLYSSMGFVLINSSLTKEFQFYKGLR